MLFDIIDSYDDAMKDQLIQLWSDVIVQLNIHNDPKKILSFLNKCAVIGIDEKEHQVHIWCPNEFVYMQVKKFFKKDLNNAISDIYNPIYKANIIVYNGLHSWESELQIDISKIIKQRPNTSPNKTTPTMPWPQEAPLEVQIKTWLEHYFWILFEKKYSFDNFVVGATNELAYSAGQAIAENPGEVYNPFFIYGEVWLGKTHLMQAIGNHIIANKSDLTVVYLPTSKLIDRIIHAVRFNKLDTLKEKLESVDVLMLDDIQFLAGKEKTQEIFHNIFNDFVSRKKQIVITSDQAPKALTLLEPRLQSRFSLWLIADIKAPDSETRIAILRSKLAKKDETLDDKHLDIIASSVTSNIRELEWALNIIITRKQLLKKEITDTDVINALETLGIEDIRSSQAPELDTQANFVDAPPISPVDENTTYSIQGSSPTALQGIEQTLAWVADYFGLKLKVIRWDSRLKEISFARQCCMYIAKTRFHRSLQKIWDYFGGKNHSSVIYAIKTFEKYLKAHPEMKKTVESF